MDFVKNEQDDDQQAFLPKFGEDVSFPDREVSRKATSTLTRYLRLILEIAMAFMIVILFFRPFPDRRTGKPTPVPSFPLKTYTFLENPRYLHENMFASEKETLHTLHNWIELSADGRGYVKIKDGESFGLDPPHFINVNATYAEPVYMVSVFHQLHCLSYVVQAFQTGFNGVGLSQEVAHHSAHCFDYIRQSIMCAADTSLEGKAEADPGWGSKHECKDYDALLAWANERDVYKYRKTMPDEATL